ncbi:coiled-coil domain-containing protein 87 [Balearica regulorum gibbericeps]|uniref:coiled-coil domain-containing protein 87 n=1 Tax=Balearica regulorum gibbericeps TaxID=100784 RepID=UPI003F643EDE
MATACPGTPGVTSTPCPEPPTASACAGTARLPPRCLSPAMPVSHGELPAPEIPPDALAVTADLHQLTRRVAREDRGEPSAGYRLPPLLAALTRRAEDDARLQQLRCLRLPVRPVREVLLPHRPLGPRLFLRPGAARPWAPPSRAFGEGVALRPYPPLCRNAGWDPRPDPLGVRELYRELVRALPAERLHFHHEPLVEPAAAAADLLPPGEQGPRNAGKPPQHGDARHRQRQTACLFDDYLQYVADTGSDFLRTIFHLRGGVGEEEPAGAPRPRRDPAPRLAEPYEKGLWKPVLLEPAPVGLERLQRRLHRLWAALGVPSQERMEMAVKYGTGGVLARLPAALDAWEAAASGILQRELLLARLERLEERGSDPMRFFHGGPASATARAEETRARGRLRAALARCEARLSAALRRLWDGFGDTATFRGRPYAEKMRRDEVEMLYWLQQRRRAGALQAALGVQPQRHPPGTAGAETSGCQ